MSVDKSLKLANSLQRQRNVLTRSEQIETLRDRGLWQDGQSIFGLPKVRVRHSKAGTKTKKEDKAAEAAPEAEAAEGAAEGEAPAAKPAER